MFVLLCALYERLKQAVKCEIPVLWWESIIHIHAVSVWDEMHTFGFRSSGTTTQNREGIQKKAEKKTKWNQKERKRNIE